MRKSALRRDVAGISRTLAMRSRARGEAGPGPALGGGCHCQPAAAASTDQRYPPREDARGSRTAMITDEVRDLLIAQVGHELNAHQAYYGISLYFEVQSLAKWAGLFRSQSVEEAQHAAKIISFLVDNGIPYDLPAIGPGTTRYASGQGGGQGRS